MESEYSPSESGFVQKGQSMPAYKILFAIPPYLGDKIEAIRPGKLRSFFAFPHGVLCLASYIKKATSGAHEIKINDCNQYSVAQGPVMFDVSYKHVAGLAAAAKAANPETKVILGGAAITTAWDVILNDQPFVDALCYSEGELALVKLLDSGDLQKELLTDPWVTRQSIGAG